MNWRRLLPWLVLLVLLAVMLAWPRRLKHGSRAPAPGGSSAPVDLTRHDGQTIDFSSGRPVVTDTPADRAALERTLREMAEAAKTVTFAPPQPAPPAAPAKKPGS